jgi:class 3 adenylate cyclase
MNVEEFFNKKNIIDLSFFNFRNAITAAYFADQDLRILRVNDNFKTFFPVLGNVSNAYFPDVLEQLGVPGEQIEDFVSTIESKGFVQIPAIHISIDGKDRVFSLLSTRTKDDSFSYLNNIQGQFVDRTDEWRLREEREHLLEQITRDQKLIEEKSARLENLANQLAKHLSPQIYKSIFEHTEDAAEPHKRKNLTIFLSDIVKFTDLTDTLEPERLAAVINSYLSEMASIALDCGGTLIEFIGDAVFVFFGDPESKGEVEDALKCVEMGLRMRTRAAELQKYWQNHGVPHEMDIRVGIATGFCTVGNFGSEQRLKYTALGRPVNLAARLESLAKPGEILIDETTHGLIHEHVTCDQLDQVTVKGFARPVQVYQVGDFLSEDRREDRRQLSHVGKHVEVNVIDSSDMRALIEELRDIQQDFEKRLSR